MTRLRILVLGASGMLGSQAIRVLAPDFDVWGACRDTDVLPDLGVSQDQIIAGLDAMDHNSIYDLIAQVGPDVVINAVGIVKQLENAKAAIPSITVNSLWPHVVADACAQVGARMVHVSTDCVFSGHTTPQGGYRESDTPDANDLYGRSKLLGEVVDAPNAITLRTSIIGWQIGPQTSLIGWFAEHRAEPIKGYTKAVFSGLSTAALIRVIRDVVIPNTELSGLYHVSVEPIDKHTLLTSLAQYCGWDVDITPSDDLVVDKTLNSERFQKETGWKPPSWDEMLSELAETFKGSR